MQITNNSTTGAHPTWNGGFCSTCAAHYVGYHRCSREDILRRIADLTRLLDPLPTQTADRTAGCPCRPENGGSGICGCIFGGPTVTC